MLRTNSYIGCTEEEVMIGKKYCLGQLVDTESEELVEDILASCSVCFEGVNIEITYNEVIDELLDTVVTVVDMY